MTPKNLIIIATLALIAIGISSCKIHEDPEKVYRNAAKKRSEIQSAKFDLLVADLDDDDLSRKKFYIKRDPQDTLKGIRARIESEDEVVTIYSKGTLSIVYPARKEVLVVEQPKFVERFFNRFTDNIESVLYSKEKAPEDIDIGKGWAYRGNSRVDGRMCSILHRKSEHTRMRELIFYVTEYYDCENGVIRKSETSFWANGVKIQHTKDLVKNLSVNEMVCDALFEYEIPKGYDRRLYRNIAKEREEEPRKPRKELLEEGAPAPDFTLNDGEGRTVTLSELRGSVVVLDFWGTWCGWCKVAMPKINKIYKKYKDRGVHIIGISCREPEGADPVGYMRGKRMEYPTFINGDEVAERYNVSGYPTLYIISPDGNIAFNMAGYASGLDKLLTKKIDELLKKSTL